MNGKIKTKFAALFAVALMITVCVVPMVGGSEDVEAATTETVTISGTVVDAHGTAFSGYVKVYVDGTDLYSIKNNGTFSISDVPKGKVVLKVDTNTEKFKEGDNKVYGQTFPVITLDNVTDTESQIRFVAGMATVSGSLTLKGGAAAKIKDVSISGAEGAVKTDADGNFSFLGYVGKKYSLSANAVSTTFKAEFTLADTGKTDLALSAQDYLIYGTASAPFGTISVKTATSPAVNSISSVSNTVFSIDSTGAINVFVKPTISTANKTTATTLLMTFGYGIKVVEDVINLTGSDNAPAVIATDYSVSFTAPNAYVIKAIVGGVAVPIDSAKLYGYATDDAPATGEKTTLRTIDANVVNGIGYVGDIYDYNITGTKANGLAKDGIITNANVIPSYKSYKFTEKAKSSSLSFDADNVKYVELSAKNGTADMNGVEFTVNATDAVVSGGEFITDSNGSLRFYVPYGTSVTVTAPANFTPSVQTVSAVNGNITLPTFDYLPTITYTGKVLLNGVALKNVGLQFTDDGNITGALYSSTGITWHEDEDGIPYYSISVNRDVDPSKILVKDYNSGYKFAKDDKNADIPVGVVSGTTTFADYIVQPTKMKVTSVDGTLVIPGMEYTFYMLKPTEAATPGAAASFDEKLIAAELGKATTDAKGDAELKTAAEPIDADNYTIWAITDGESDFGAYGEGKIKITEVATPKYDCADKTVYGFYTADATAIPGLEISYVEYKDGSLVGNGKATIIDNMYYIVFDKGNNVKLSVDTDKYKADFIQTGYGKGIKDLEISVVPEDLSITVTPVTNEYSDFVEITIPVDPVKGDVVVLSAQETCYKVQNVMYGYKYSDAAVEYTFAGWYVNGKLLTEDCDASITLSEDVVIVAQYEEAVKVIASEEAPEAGLDTNVLILGIVVVVIALIAVIYSVISKRD